MGRTAKSANITQAIKPSSLIYLGSYRVRIGQEAEFFFCPGRVFSAAFSDAQSTTGYQIMRFVIVKMLRNSASMIAWSVHSLLSTISHLLFAARFLPTKNLGHWSLEATQSILRKSTLWVLIHPLSPGT